jgi:hypothetical protein
MPVTAIGSTWRLPYMRSLTATQKMPSALRF